MTVLWLGLMVGSVHAQIKTVSLRSGRHRAYHQRYDHGFQRPFCHEGEEYEKQTESQFHGV